MRSRTLLPDADLTATARTQVKSWKLRLCCCFFVGFFVAAVPLVLGFLLFFSFRKETLAVRPLPRVPFFEVTADTDYELGFQIGQKLKNVYAQLDLSQETPSKVASSIPYLLASIDHFPWVVAQFRGIADGAGMDFGKFWTSELEELDDGPDHCSDFIATPSTTSNHHMLIAHNNDVDSKAQLVTAATLIKLKGRPSFLALGDPLISVCFSSKGFVVTGNQLYGNDSRIGVPRNIIFWAMCFQDSVEDALRIANFSHRASSYNQIFVTKDKVFDFEGSATDYELIHPDSKGFLAHTNHYASDKMRKYEGHTSYLTNTATRLRRAYEMLHQEPNGTMTEVKLHRMLGDHANFPYSICRHDDLNPGVAGLTIFWFVCDVTEMRIVYGNGVPCEGTPSIFQFPEWRSATAET